MVTKIENIPNRYIVYMHIAPSNKRYIGITCQDVQQRWRNGKGYKKNQAFFNAIKKYGWDNIRHVVVECNLDFKEAAETEKRLILEFNTTDKRFGYNICHGGEDGWVGVHHTEEAKAKMSAAKRGKTYRKGYKLSEETKEKISKAHKGKYKGVPVEKREKIKKGIYNENGKRIFSEEHRAKISNALKGIQRSDAVRKNMSIAQKKTKRSVRCINDGQVFESMTAAGKEYGINKTLICRACSGRNKTAKGLRFEYVNKEESKENV